MTRAYLTYCSDWEVATLAANPSNEVIDSVGSGSTPSTHEKECWGGSIYWLTPKDITGKVPRFVESTDRLITEEGLKQAGELWPANTVMVTKRAPVGCVVINSVPMATNQGFLNFRCGKKLLPEFLYYWLKVNTPYLDAVANGSTYPELYADDLFEFQIAIPSLAEQKTIVQCLTTLDKKVELNLTMNKNLEALARAIYKSWFVDFDPVTTKIAGRKPIGMDDATAELFPDSFEETTMGAVPKGWKIEKLEALLNLAYGKSLKDSKRRVGNIPVYGSNGQVGWHDKALVKGPGIVVGRKGNAGTVTWASIDFYPIDTTFYVISKHPDVNLYFLFYVLKDHDLSSLEADSAVPGLNRNIAYQNKQIVPPKEILDAFASSVSIIFQKIKINNKENASLIELRNLLLPKLLSGGIRVKQAEKLLQR